MNKSVAIIGGGPAGLMAAETAIQAGFAVTVYEQMPSLSRKFLMAGRGGLNLTHTMPKDKFLSQYGEAEDWLEPMINAFRPQALHDWSGELGEPAFVGSSGRVFPKSFKTSPLLRAWLRRLDDAGVEFRVRHTWRGWNEEGALLFDHEGMEVAVNADSTVLALGGGSWAKLGSNGHWTEILEGKDIAIEPLLPSNMGFKAQWSEILKERFSGQAVKNVSLSFEGVEARGDLMITQQGIEGGAAYALSSKIRDRLLTDGYAVATVDLRPDLSAENLFAKLEKTKKSLSLTSKLKRLGLSPSAVALLREQPLSGKKPAQIVELIKLLPFEIIGFQPIDRAISSAGGVALSEVNDDLMLNKMPGVFVAGEMLDWEAPTGGFLLQACFATGKQAGAGVAQWLESVEEL